MALAKCPRCELNYVKPGEKYCTVCKRELRGEDNSDTVEICTNCGERPALPGEDYCAVCLKEMSRTEGYTANENTSEIEPETSEESTLDMHSASEMDEIDIGMEDDTIPEGEYNEIKNELEADEDFGSVSLHELAEAEDSDEEEEEDNY
ncbi:MAG: hypothetical protein E7334_02630 [Clostridiales bacterium]|nr:hypothetical protein [Clostridiales bacterium]